ncbi:MAG TPA: ABC transporter permease [Deltaproteobacteria bacterium]|nr:ABC transporter permease [Deltaproteobacteria bacterium]
MSDAAVHMSLTGEEILTVHLKGKWQMETDAPSTETMGEQLEQHPSIKRVAFDATALGSWDSSLLIFFFEISKLSAKKNVEVEKEGLPAGIRQLIDLATAVPKKEDARKSVSRAGFFARVGLDVTDFVKSAGDLVTFIGAAFEAFVRMVMGRARFRASDLGLFLQEAGAQAVPIVSLISFLIGLILAFVGILQLAMFGAEVYVADLVGIAMVREMGAIMTGIIMAGRTGAAYAAQLGTMQVNEEIDALETLAVPPMEFLVLPRVVALTLMMPFLVLYADLMGILGGALVAVGMYDINIIVYLNRTKAAIGLNDLFIGLFMSLVFGILVALSGCLRGMQCGRSASAVGDAATSAVVTGIVAIIIATAVITVVCSILGI